LRIGKVDRVESCEMARPKGGGGRSKIASRIPIEREPAGRVARVRLGSYEFKEKGVSRFDLRDPYHLGWRGDLYRQGDVGPGVPGAHPQIRRVLRRAAV
jgi:hypothetical protein